MINAETKPSRHLQQGLTLLFWSSLLEQFLPAVLGAIYGSIYHDFPELESLRGILGFIFPVMGVLAFVGVILITLDGSQSGKAKYLKRLLPAFAAITLLFRFTSPLSIPVMHIHAIRTTFEVIATFLCALYFIELCNEANKKDQSNSWNHFIKFYLVTIILTEISEAYIKTRYSGIEQSTWVIGNYLFRIPVWIYGLRLLLQTRKELSERPNTNGEQSA